MSEEKKIVVSNRTDAYISALLLKESLTNYVRSEINYSKNKILNIPTRIKDSYLDFKTDVIIANYDKAIDTFNLKKEDILRKKATRKKKHDFQAAVRREKREEFIEDAKEKIFGNVTKAKSGLANIKNKGLDIIRKNTTLDLKIASAATSVKIAKAKIDNTVANIKKEQDFINKTNNYQYSGIIPNDNNLNKVTKKSFIGVVSSKILTRFKAKGNDLKNKIADMQINHDIAKANKALLLEQQRQEMERNNALKNAQLASLQDSLKAVNEDMFKDSIAVDSVMSKNMTK